MIKIMIIKLTISIIISLFLVSCFSTNPKSVKTSDAQKISKVDYGIIISSLPVKIKGESSWVGATAGAMIGGLLGTQLCGEKEIIGTKCQDIGVVFGVIGGAAAGTVTQAILGNHDGFQYIIDLDNSDKDFAFVQGDFEAILDGQRVVIIYGKDVRILPHKE
jgi:outer membrane lipoprotein SlyB